MKDEEGLTYQRIGEYFALSTERARQIIKLRRSEIIREAQREQDPWYGLDNRTRDALVRDGFKTPDEAWEAGLERLKVVDNFGKVSLSRFIKFMGHRRGKQGGV